MSKKSVNTRQYLYFLPHFTIVIKFFLQILIFVILIGFIGGVIRTFFDIELIFNNSVEVALRQIILDVLALMAVLEMLKTVMSYLSDGRVRVRYIIDTVLIVMFNEVISLWFKGKNLDYLYYLLTILLVLIFIRVVAIRFSPDTEELH